MSTNALSQALQLARIALAFGRVERVTRHEDGLRPETDTDHTVMLGLVACELAPARLDRARVAAFALVHDLAEVYAGDTQTLVISPEVMAAKQVREDAARARLSGEFGDGSWLAGMLATYEQQCEPEARFVRLMDKVLPKLTHAFNGCAAAALITDWGGFIDAHTRQFQKLREEYPEFDDALALLGAAMRHAEGCWPQAESNGSARSTSRPPDLAAIRAQLAAAAKGPYTVGEENVDPNDPAWNVQCADGSAVAAFCTFPQAAMFAAAPTHIAALCTEVEQRRAQFERGRAAAVALAKDAEAVCAENTRLRAEVARLSRWLDRGITPEDAVQYALGILAAGSLDAPNYAEFGGTIERPDGTKRTAVVSVQWVDGKTPHALVAERTAERDFHQHKAEEWEESAEIERARAEAAEAECVRLRAESASLSQLLNDARNDAVLLADENTDLRSGVDTVAGDNADLTAENEALAAECDSMRARFVTVCETQAEMLDKAGDPDGAKGARLCAVVLRLLTMVPTLDPSPAG